MASNRDMNRDSSVATMKHQAEVARGIAGFCWRLQKRALQHDASKLKRPEKPAFDIATWKLSKMEYGSPEYKKSRKELQPTLEHHYAMNDHHPEHFPNGVNGMTLDALVEMFYDWSASVKRNKNGDIFESIEINTKRFKLSKQLKSILINTALADKAKRRTKQLKKK